MRAVLILATGGLVLGAAVGASLAIGAALDALGAGYPVLAALWGGVALVWAYGWVAGAYACLVEFLKLAPASRRNRRG